MGVLLWGLINKGDMLSVIDYVICYVIHYLNGSIKN